MFTIRTERLATVVSILSWREARKRYLLPGSAMRPVKRFLRRWFNIGGRPGWER